MAFAPQHYVHVPATSSSGPGCNPAPPQSPKENRSMLTVGDKLPQFKLKATVSNDLSNAFVDIDNDTYKGKWLVLFFYPKDFTFVCPTEITGFAKHNQAFLDRDAQL